VTSHVLGEPLSLRRAPVVAAVERDAPRTTSRRVAIRKALQPSAAFVRAIWRWAESLAYSCENTFVTLVWRSAESYALRV